MFTKDYAKEIFAEKKLLIRKKDRSLLFIVTDASFARQRMKIRVRLPDGSTLNGSERSFRLSLPRPGVVLGPQLWGLGVQSGGRPLQQPKARHRGHRSGKPARAVLEASTEVASIRDQARLFDEL